MAREGVPTNAERQGAADALEGAAIFAGLPAAAAKILSGDARGARVRLDEAVAAIRKAHAVARRMEAEQIRLGCYLDAVPASPPTPEKP